MDDFRKHMELTNSREYRNLIKTVNTVAGFKLSIRDRQSFLHFHDYISNPQPDFITNWRADDKLKKWSNGITNGILGSVQKATGAVMYHSQNLLKLENDIHESLDELEFRKVIGNSGIAGGDTSKLDFEYQAFILAYRRLLDYFARAVCCYFKTEFHSFRQLDKILKKNSRSHVSEYLLITHEEFLPIFDFVASNGSYKSVRDRISHYEFVGVGVFHLNKLGVAFSLEGQEAAPWYAETLDEVTTNQINYLRRFLRSGLQRFVAGMKEDNA